MRTAIFFWTFEAVLLAAAVCIGIWGYNRVKGQSLKPLNLAVWILVVVVLVVLFNLLGR